MNEETVFKKIAKETLDNIYSRLDGEEKQFLSYLVNCFNISCEKREQLQNNWNELKKFTEKEKDRLARECSQIYEDSLGKTRLVNEDIYNEVKNISDKMQELEQGKDG